MCPCDVCTAVSLGVHTTILVSALTYDMSLWSIIKLQDDVARLSNMLMEKEAELAAVKRKLGITPYVEFKQSMSQGWKVVGDKWKEVQETET